MNAMRLKSLLLSIVAILCIFLSVSPPDVHAAPLVLPVTAGRLPLAGHLELLVDTTGSLTIQDVTSAAISSWFRPVPGNISAGFIQHGAVWVKFTIQRTADAPPIWILEADPALNESLQLYLPSAHGDIETRAGGSLRPFSTQEMSYRLNVFRLTLPADSPQTIHLRIASHRPIILNPVLWQPDAFSEASNLESLAHGAYMGIVLLIVLINILFWIRLKESLYIFYSWYVLALAIVFVDYSGYLHQFIVTDRTWLLSPVVRLGLISALIANTGVFSHLVDLKKNFPRINRLYCRCFFGSGAFLAALTFFGMYDVIIIPVLVMLLVAATVSVMFSMYLVVNRFPGATLYLAAFGPLILVSCSRVLNYLGIVSYIGAADLSWLASLPHIIILNIAVSNHVAKIRQESRIIETALVVERNTVAQQRQFLHLISHELRTPLAIIDSTAQILPLLRTDQKKFEKKAVTIIAATQRMRLLLDNCLSDDRLSIDGIKPDMKNVDCLAIARRVVDSAQSRTEIHQIALEAQEDTCTFTCDPILIEILLNNLVENAIKYSPEGGTVTLRTRAGRLGELYLEVSDHGAGISEEQSNKVFERFYRCGQVPGVSGAGLGLYLVRQIARLHGGDVTCSSTPGCGSTFTVRLCPSV